MCIAPGSCFWGEGAGGGNISYILLLLKLTGREFTTVSTESVSLPEILYNPSEARLLPFHTQITLSNQALNDVNSYVSTLSLSSFQAEISVKSNPNSFVCYNSHCKEQE